MSRLLKRYNWHSILIWIVAIAAIAAIVWLSVVIKEPDNAFDNEMHYEIAQGWKVSYGQNTENVELPAKIKAKSGEMVVYSTILEGKDTYCNMIMFRSSHQFVKVFVGEEEISAYGYNQKKPNKTSVGSIWQTVRLPQDWEGKEIRIETIGYYDEYSGIQNIVFLGTKASLMFMILDNTYVSLIINFTILVMGLLFLIGGCIFRDFLISEKMRYLGLFAVATSAWLLSEMRITQFFTGNTLLFSNVVFVLLGLVPVFSLRFMLTFESLGNSRYMKRVYALSVAAYLMIQALKVLDVVDYMDSVYVTHVILVLEIIGILYNYIKLKRKKQEVKDRSVYLSCLIFAVFGVFELIFFYIGNPSIRTGFFAQIGLLSFMCILAGYGVKYTTREKMERVERETLQKLAYTDILTGTKNRTSFEDALEKCREDMKDYIIMVLDINNLKVINDTYGHKAGDSVIIKTVKALENNFGDKADCYRIGGDEFVVISETFSENEFKNRLESFNNEIAVDVSDVVLKVAFGYVLCSGKNIDQAFIDADALMYDCKQKMKNTVTM